MKKSLFKFMVFLFILGFTDCKSSTDPSQWSSKQIDSWFEKGQWLNGWQVKPDQSIDRKAFAVSYFKNRERWDKAFVFLKENDLLKLEIKKYDIDGDNVFATSSEYMSKNEEDVRYEAHRKYIDIQYVISGKELIGHTPASMKKDILVPYDETKDVEFMTVTKGTASLATPDNFFIFSPDDLHRPSMRDGESSQVKKVVVKIKVE